VQAVIEGLEDHQPRVVWDALPASYQTDIRDLISTFCSNMDADIYDRMFRILGKAVQVMNEKKEFIHNSPVVLSTPLLESSLGSQWNDTVGLLNTISKSDLSSLESLSRMDPGEFLGSTGHQVMDTVEAMRVRSQRSPGLNRWAQMSQTLKQTKIDFVNMSDNQGVLLFNSPTNDAVKEVDLTFVEGRWVPADLAAAWPDKVNEARERMTKLSGPDFAKAKPIISMLLGSLEGTMDSLLKAGSQKEFDEKLKSLAAIGGMAKAMANSKQQEAQ